MFARGEARGGLALRCMKGESRGQAAEEGESYRGGEGHRRASLFVHGGGGGVDELEAFGMNSRRGAGESREELTVRVVV